jgi:hypothetical protein
MTLRKQFAHVVRPRAPSHTLKILVEAPVDMDQNAKEMLKAVWDRGLASFRSLFACCLRLRSGRHVHHLQRIELRCGR